MTASVISRLLHVLHDRDLAVVRRPRRARHPAVAERRVADRLHRFPRRVRIADVRHLDALHTHVEQAQDERGIEPGRAHDRRDAGALGRHDHELNVAQVEARVLHVDEGRVEAGVADDLDDLRIGDAARVGAEREPALTQDLLHAIRLHVASVSALFWNTLATRRSVAHAPQRLSRSCAFWILPLDVIGNSSTKTPSRPGREGASAAPIAAAPSPRRSCCTEPRRPVSASELTYSRKAGHTSVAKRRMSWMVVSRSSASKYATR
jgi:hypothetical protein